MSKALSIHAGERGLVRVFALSLPADEAATLASDKSASLQRLLGLPDLAEDQCEFFAIADLDDLGLPGYLSAGYGISDEVILPDKARLAGLDGWVLLVRSTAFNGQPSELELAAEVTLIGTYAEPGVDWTEGAALTSQAATEPVKTAKKRPSDAAMSGRIATYALLFLFAFTAVIIWIAS